MASTERHRDTTAPAAFFATTHWTVIVDAGRDGSPQVQAALETLCRTYWYPLYAFVRRQGYSPHDAQDLTQAFFARFLEMNFLADVQRERGKFRSFLLASLKHFLANEWDHAHAQKRGGGKGVISSDEKTTEGRYRLEPRDEMTAEKIYERRWALTLLDRVLARLRDEYGACGKTPQFEALKVFLSDGKGSIPYAAVAAELGSACPRAKLKCSCGLPKARATLISAPSLARPNSPSKNTSPTSSKSSDSRAAMRPP